MAAGNQANGPAQAAAALLQERVHYIEELDRARNAERRARAAVEQAKIAAHDAAVRTGEAYRAALDAGEQCLKPVDRLGGAYLPGDRVAGSQAGRRANVGREGTPSSP